MAICEQFEDLIENQKWYNYLYISKYKPKKERALKLLFFGVAEAYIDANKLNAEVKIDAKFNRFIFKIKDDKESSDVNVFVNYLSNSNIDKTIDINIRNLNDDTSKNQIIHCLVQKNWSKKQKRIEDRIEDSKKRGLKTPDFVFINGRN
tara:strand:- start:22088 stop:22534 length:447 start_codon:yes stop_codon:yes gene_type:complete